MNFKNQQSNDEIIERELRALREPVESHQGLDASIRAMRSTPSAPKSRMNPWVLRVGTVGVAAVGIAVAVRVTTPKAYAQELREIALAQGQQKTMYMKAVMLDGHTTPDRTVELWTDSTNETMHQFNGAGEVECVTVCDGSHRYFYYAGDEAHGIKANASYDDFHSETRGIETIDSMLHSEFFQKHKIEKTSGVTINGKTCDYYNFANGYYRLWVDPATKLPIQREIYNKGVSLWERDVYEYPSTFPKETFQAPEVPGVSFYAYPTTRKQFMTTLSGSGQTQKVGDISINLKAVVRDGTTINAIWTSTGIDAGGTGVSSLQIEGAQAGRGFVTDLSRLPSVPGPRLLNEQLFLQWGQPFQTPATIKIAAWAEDKSHPSKNGKPGMKLVGWATFNTPDILVVPSASQLLARPTGDGGVATAVSVKK